MAAEKTLVRGRIFNPQSRSEWSFYEDGALIFNGQGRIEAVGDYATLKNTPDIGATWDYSGNLIMPGLIDVHTHLPQLPIRGITAGTLLDWLNNYAFPVEEAFAEAGYAQQLSDTFFSALKANGTTTAVVLSTVHEASTDIAFESARQSGMRVVMGKVMMDQNGPKSLLETTKDAIAASDRLATKWHKQNDDLLRYAFTPRFALSCSQALLEASGDLCRKYPDSYLQSHLSENTKEVEEVKALYKGKFSYTEIYEVTGCLGPRTIMAHGIHLTFDEYTFLHDTGTRIAHCPTSNFFLRSGFFNLPVFRDRGIPFALGTDVGGGPDLSLFHVMRVMDEAQLRHQVSIKPTEALYYATLAGAEVLSLEDETGNLEPGKSADFIVVDLTALDSPQRTDQSPEETLSKLVYLSGQQHVVKTVVRGKEIYENRLLAPTGSVSTPAGVL